MDQRKPVAWDLFYRDGRFVVYHSRFEIVATLCLVGIAALLAAVALFLSHNASAPIRLLVGYLAFATFLVASLKLARDWRAVETPPSPIYFISAGALAGCIGALVPRYVGLSFALKIVGIVVASASLYWFALWLLWRLLNRWKANLLKRMTT